MIAHPEPASPHARLALCASAACAALAFAAPTAQAQVTVTPKIGTVVYGPSTGEVNCQESGQAFEGTCGALSVLESGADASALSLGVDATLRLIPQFQVGIGAVYQTEARLNPVLVLGLPFSSLGSDLMTYAFVESMHPISGTLEIGARLQGGLYALFPDNDLVGAYDLVRERCQNATSCVIDEDVRSSWTVGGGLAIQGVVQDIDLRGELIVSYIGPHNIMDFDVEAAAGNAFDADVSIEGWRSMMMFGVMFGR